MLDKNILLPGEIIEIKDKQINDSNNSLINIKDNYYSSHNAGEIQIKEKKWKFNLLNKKYYSNLNDQVIGKVVKKAGDYYYLDIGAEKVGILNILDFSGASKNNRPVLDINSYVYCKIKLIPKSLPIELTCISKKDKKDWSSFETLYGPLRKGMIFKFSQKFLNLLRKDDTYFQKINKYISIEVVISNNNILLINLDLDYDLNYKIINQFLKEVEFIDIKEGLLIIENYLNKLQIK